MSAAASCVTRDLAGAATRPVGRERAQWQPHGLAKPWEWPVGKAERVLSRAVSATWLVNASVTDLATDALKMQRKESLEHYQALRSLGDSDELAVGWNAGTTGKLGWSHKYEKETVISGAAKGNFAAAVGAAASASAAPAGASAGEGDGGADVAAEAGRAAELPAVAGVAPAARVAVRVPVVTVVVVTAGVARRRSASRAIWSKT